MQSILDMFLVFAQILGILLKRQRIGTEVDDYRLKSAVQDKWLLYCFDHRLNANKNEHIKG